MSQFSTSTDNCYCCRSERALSERARQQTKMVQLFKISILLRIIFNQHALRLYHNATRGYINELHSSTTRPLTTSTWQLCMLTARVSIYTYICFNISMSLCFIFRYIAFILVLCFNIMFISIVNQ